MEFKTVDEYLEKLRRYLEALHTRGSLGLAYLAAVVSDFYVPYDKMATHRYKIAITALPCHCRCYPKAREETQ